MSIQIQGKHIDWRILAGVVIILILAPFMLFRGGSTIPHGYDGVVSKITSISHGYDSVTMLGYPDSLYYAGLNPDVYMLGTSLSSIRNPTGIKLSVTAPQYEKTLNLDPLSKNETVTKDGRQWVKETTLKRSIVTFEMFATMKTYEETYADNDAITDVIFWIELKNNDMSVFTDPDDVAVAILSVRTDGLPVKEQVGLELEFFPDAGGQDLPLTTATGSETYGATIPRQAGINVEGFNNLRIIKFPIHIITATPIGTSIFSGRIDCQAKWDFKVEVLLIGQWVELRPYAEYIPPTPEKPWWESLFDFIGGIFDAIGTFFSDPINLIIIAVIAIVILIIFLKVLSIRFGGGS